MAMPDLQSFLLNHYLINNVENTAFFLGLKVLQSDNFYTFFCSINAQVTLVEKQKSKNNQFLNYKY